MSARVRQGTKEDVASIMMEPSSIVLDDLRLHNLTPEEVAQQIDFYVENGTLHTIEYDGVPIFTGGVVFNGEQWMSWSVCREEFWSTHPSIWRILRQYFQQVLPALREPVHAYSGSKHPALARWFRAIGFEEAEPVGDFRHFIYPA
jgi:hypothetical protein